MYDIAIVGAGPAGLSAAVTARARGLKTVVVGNKPQDSPLAKSHLVDNYPGLPGLSGLQLLEQLMAHAHQAGAEFENARVISVLPVDAGFFVTPSGKDAQPIEAASVDLACGTAAAAKPYPGEQEYLGRGVSYCATCDGMFYRQSVVVVAALSAEAASEARFLADLGAALHYVAGKLDVETRDTLGEGIAVHEGRIVAIEGDALGVTGVRIQAKLGADLTEEVAISCQGVFVLRPSIAPAALLPTLELRDGFIAVDGQMATSVPGVFAAGDCTGQPLQVAKAVGQGQVAALSAVEYIRTIEN